MGVPAFLFWFRRFVGIDAPDFSQRIRANVPAPAAGPGRR
jgi:hypothetical protein